MRRETGRGGGLNVDGSVLAQLEEIRRQLEVLMARVSPSLPLVVTKAKAAELLSVSPSTIKAMLRRGELVPARVHDRLLIPTSELVRISTSLRVTLPDATSKAWPKRTRYARQTEGEKIRASLKAAKVKRKS